MLNLEYQEHEVILKRYPKKLMRQGKSPIVVFCGSMRSGKTWLALKIAQDLDPNFSCEKQLFFSVERYLEYLANNKRSVCILDEAGHELSSYQWLSAKSEAMSVALQTQSYKQIVSFICLPHISDLAKRHRKFVHLMVWVQAPGIYTLYAPSISYWDFNELDMKTNKLEVCSDVPAPSKALQEEYLNKFEGQIKSDILATITENLMLDNKKRESRMRWANSGGQEGSASIEGIEL